MENIPTTIHGSHPDGGQASLINRTTDITSQLQIVEDNSKGQHVLSNSKGQQITQSEHVSVQVAVSSSGEDAFTDTTDLDSDASVRPADLVKATPSSSQGETASVMSPPSLGDGDTTLVEDSETPICSSQGESSSQDISSHSQRDSAVDLDSIHLVTSQVETSKIFISDNSQRKESGVILSDTDMSKSRQVTAGVSMTAESQPLSEEVLAGEKRTNSGDEKSHSGKRYGLMSKYGELVILGYNGSLPQGDKGRKRSKFALCRRQSPNGVKPSRKSIVKSANQSEAVRDNKQHSVSYTLSRHQTVIVEYCQDENIDMFQIGRSSEQPIDFVVMDTVPGNQRSMDCVVTQSTISRFACRITVERIPPFTARIYAAGFDSARNIFLGEKATKWHTEEGSIDGLTTNGILIMHPNGGFNSNAKPGIWREVSVGGGIYSLRESRSTAQKSLPIENETNILLDGTLIDLCGATLLWRSASGLMISPSPRELEHQIRQINAARPQCPVGLNTLVLPHKNTLTAAEKQPYVYLNCGHVHGQHGWGKKAEAEVNTNRTCPMCMTEGPFVQLKTGSEPSFYVDNSSPSRCFCACAHVASEKTVKYWSQIPIPHGCHGFQAACPFCATPLTGDPGFVRLIFQDNLD